ncbi:hypothetical protein BBF96_05500 [Anoxybacter fermentans]|uniref:TldD/PmbA family protein n=1 Tax=Anoxybacter fermentans TaxID=1323375 RepID=A0A3Q9HPX4_9FIRM|nr:TldD/PmbA family protein [Anoxybacter fermentans]AZR72892.1 hypothetical protein BBF96_05500 [Anoxybacter fermentans]
MKDLQLCQEIVEKGRSLGADEIEVYYHKEKKIEVMIEKNDLQIPKADDYEGIGIRVIKNNKVGFAATNRLDQVSIEKTLQGALDLAEMSTASPYNQLPDPQPVQILEGLIDPNGFSLTAEKAVEQAGIIMETVLRDSRVTLDSANVKGSFISRAIANSRGQAVREDRTLYECFLIGFARDGDDISSFNVEFISGSNFEKLPIREKSEKLARKVVNTLGAKSIPSFKGSVILSPLAIHYILLQPLSFVLRGEAVVTGMSPLKEKLGEMISSHNLTLVDDPTFADGYYSRSFDREGVPSIRLPIITKGQLNSFLHTNRTALKANTVSTGHASGNDQSITNSATNLMIEPGDVSLEEMIQDIKRGILVNRFSGNSDPISGDFSGVVKGGYYIENGEIVQPIREVMIAGNFYQMLNQISQLSNEVENFESSYTPYIQFEGVSITGR